MNELMKLVNELASVLENSRLTNEQKGSALELVRSALTYSERAEANIALHNKTLAMQPTVVAEALATALEGNVSPRLASAIRYAAAA